MGKIARPEIAELRIDREQLSESYLRICSGIGDAECHGTEIDSGAVMSVVVPARDLKKPQAPGFIGVIVHGMHHQAHHMMIARGEHPH